MFVLLVAGLHDFFTTGFIDSIVSKTTIAHLTAEKLETVPWPDVPPYEQSVIAGYLDTHCEKIDLAIGIKQKQLDALSGIKRSFLQRVVTRGKEPNPILISTGNSWLEHIPEGWSLVTGHAQASCRNSVRPHVGQGL